MVGVCENVQPISFSSKSKQKECYCPSVPPLTITFTDESFERRVINFVNYCVTSCMCIGTIKNSHSYIVQIINFFEKMFKLYMVLTYTFFKLYIHF